MMTETSDRRLPVGIQSFKEIRKGNYLYVDKTDLIWNLANKGYKFNYLSRPRRFGKSVLVDTLQAYFEGKKELFEGLKIMEMEKEWKSYPVIRLDMSQAGATASELRSYLDCTFAKYELKYGIPVEHEDLLGNRIHAIIKSACEQTGLDAVVLIDDYDFPLLHSWGTPEYEPCTDIYSNIFCVLKGNDYYEKLVFITANTKLTQFSHGLNNLSYIGLCKQTAAICGFTEQEIADYFMPYIKSLGKKNDWTTIETTYQLKAYYGGYHFSTDNTIEIFNPASLIKALANQEVNNYMASSDTATLWSKLHNVTEISNYSYFLLLDFTMDTADITEGGTEFFLYQFGYLTIKEHKEGLYYLDFPNGEAKEALQKLLDRN